MAAHSPIMQDVRKRAAAGVRVLAVCNGFQIACETGLLPGALMMNAGLKFICREVNLRIETTQSEFTGKYRKGQTIRVPVAHHEGNYTLATDDRSEEHTTELQSLMRISYAVLCLKQQNAYTQPYTTYTDNK